MTRTELESRLARLRGPYGTRPNARTIASLRDNPGCAARRVLDAARVDKAKLAASVGSAVPDQQSPFAIQRGDRFEADVKADGYAIAIGLMRKLGFAVEAVRLLQLRNLYPIDPHSDVDAVLAERAHETKRALIAMARDAENAYNLIDGGALEWDFGGTTARLEADGIAWQIEGRIHVAEIKSFPIVDGRADPDKVGAAAWQGAVYLSAIAALFEQEGLPLSKVSTDLLLICPRNTSLQATVKRLDVSRQIRSLQRLLKTRAGVAELLESLPDDLVFDASGTEDERQQRLERVLSHLGTRYGPSCLSSCELAYYCRSRAHAAGSPALVSLDAVADLAGVSSLARADELARGASPKAEEAEAAERLSRVHALLTEHAA